MLEPQEAVQVELVAYLLAVVDRIGENSVEKRSLLEQIVTTVRSSRNNKDYHAMDRIS